MYEIYREICTRIKEADAILIGASNGLSITEGLHLFADNTAFDTCAYFTVNFRHFFPFLSF